MKRVTPERLEMKIEELEAIVARAKSALNDEEHLRLKAAIETLAWLTGELEQKNVSLARLQKLLFGARSEKTSQVLKESDPASGAPPESQERTRKEKPKGHGRNAAAAYTGAKRVRVPLDSLHSGDCCPDCQKGKIYPSTAPQLLVRVKGQAPLVATVYELETLRCNLCGEVFAATPPEGVGEEKYDETAAAMIALLKYGSGLPFNRLRKLQWSVGIPLPATTQWEIVKEAAVKLTAVNEQLIVEAAQGEVVHNDDTPMKILGAVGKNAAGETASSSERKGVFTTGVVSRRSGHAIALFFTGPRHAGENLAQVLKRRAAELDPPIQMCDGLSRNLPADFKTVLSNCTAHGRRKFVELVEQFPEECRYVLEHLRSVYQIEDRAHQEELSPEGRLMLHQVESGPVMEELKNWMEAKIANKEVEPNSSFGEAIQYLLKRWEPLTLFLRQPGAPLDNNICERALKKAILHRKNALFYKTPNGAWVGDLFMSLIHTAELNRVNPFHYLTELLRHCGELRREPASWMPWNYEATLANLGNASQPRPP